MRKKRHAKRTIVVDGITYTWKYGNWVEIRRGRDVVLRRRITDILGITWDDLERPGARRAQGLRLPAHAKAHRAADQGDRMTLTDQEVIDTINDVLARKNVQPSDRLRYLRENASSWPAHELKPLIDRYLRIVDPPRLCQVTHDHWEGPMICGNPMPCRTHGGR